ncbi:hypothetical protein MBLNU230_g7133t1 [Neophaeotheca triangularis]
MTSKRKHADETQAAALKSLKRSDLVSIVTEKHGNAQTSAKNHRSPKRLRQFASRLFGSRDCDHGEPLMLPRSEGDDLLRSEDPVGSPGSKEFASEFDRDVRARELSEARERATTPSSLGASWYPALMSQAHGDVLSEGAGSGGSLASNAAGASGQSEVSHGEDSIGVVVSPQRLTERLLKAQRHILAGPAPSAPTNTPVTRYSGSFMLDVSLSEDFAIDFHPEDYSNAPQGEEQSAQMPENISYPRRQNTLLDWPSHAHYPVDEARGAPQRSRVKGLRHPWSVSTFASTLKSSDANAYSFSDASSMFAAYPNDNPRLRFSTKRMDSMTRARFSFSGFTQDFHVGSSNGSSVGGEDASLQLEDHAHVQAVLESRTRAYEARAREEREKHEAEIACLTARLGVSSLQGPSLAESEASSSLVQNHDGQRGGVAMLSTTGNVVEEEPSVPSRGFGHYSRLKVQGTPAQREAKEEIKRIEDDLQRRREALLRLQPDLASQLGRDTSTSPGTRKRKNTNEGFSSESPDSRSPNSRQGFSSTTYIKSQPTSLHPEPTDRDDVIKNTQLQPYPQDVAPLQCKRRKLAKAFTKQSSDSQSSGSRSYADRALGGARKAIHEMKTAAMSKLKACRSKTQLVRQDTRKDPEVDMGELLDDALTSWSAQQAPRLGNDARAYVPPAPPISLRSEPVSCAEGSSGQTLADTQRHRSRGILSYRQLAPFSTLAAHQAQGRETSKDSVSSSR